MPEKVTAERQLARILDLIPRATRNEGAPLAELAQLVGATEKEVLRDFMEVCNRAFYQPAGVDDDVQIMIEDDRVEVWTKGEFRRPVRLTPGESLALSLGLRILAAGDAPGEGERRTALAESLEKRLLHPRGTAGAEQFDILPGVMVTDGAQRVVADSARDRHRCRITYLKPGETEPSEREIEPYVLLVAEGRWYTVGFCHRSEDIRVFRLDRVIDATPLSSPFELPPDFDPAHYVSDGRVYRSEEHEQVTVLYSPRIAPWIVEHGAAETLPDGGVLVRYSVSDPRWVVRHVLEHGPDAEVLEPVHIRKMIREALLKIRAEVS